MFGKSENREDYQYIDRPIGGMARDLPDRHFIERHLHPRGQLIYSYAGAILVTTDSGTWIVPPQRAVWVPPDIAHSMQACGEVEMRTLYVRRDRIPKELGKCCVVSISPLLREMVAAAVRMPMDYDENGRDGLLAELLLHELKPVQVLPLHLPMPKDHRAIKICNHILMNLSDETTIEEWSKTVGASSRTIIRLFSAETGLTFSRWRQQARLIAAVQLLAKGSGITDIGLQLGYDSPSAFTAMFRKALGTPPSDYFK